LQIWRQLPVPGFCERMIGFSVPQDNGVLVVSYEGIHLIHLGPPVTVESDFEYCEYDLFDHNTCVANYQGRKWEIIGLYEGRPLKTVKSGEHLVLDTEAGTVSVVQAGTVVWSSAYENFSGDWAAATFSPDSQFIVLGCPYDFDFRVFQRVK
jgi:hypothetical protein